MKNILCLLGRHRFYLHPTDYECGYFYRTCIRSECWIFQSNAYIRKKLGDASYILEYDNFAWKTIGDNKSGVFINEDKSPT